MKHQLAVTYMQLTRDEAIVLARTGQRFFAVNYDYSEIDEGEAYNSVLFPMSVIDVLILTAPFPHNHCDEWQEMLDELMGYEFWDVLEAGHYIIPCEYDEEEEIWWLRINNAWGGIEREYKLVMFDAP